MTNDRRIDQIINNTTPAILSGQETIDSILEKYPQYTEQLRLRLEAILWLGSARKNLEPRTGFISSSRKYVEDQYTNVQPHGLLRRIFRQHTPKRWIFNFSAPVILILMLALIVNNLILTARVSIPGDPFYSTKLVLEDIQLAFTFDPIQKTNLYIHLSHERTTEFIDLVLEGDFDVLPEAASRLETEIIASLHSINDLSKQDLVDKQPATSELRETLSNEIFILNILKGSSPPSAHPGIELAIQAAQSGLMVLR